MLLYAVCIVWVRIIGNSPVVLLSTLHHVQATMRPPPTYAPMRYGGGLVALDRKESRQGGEGQTGEGEGVEYISPNQYL